MIVTAMVILKPDDEIRVAHGAHDGTDEQFITVCTRSEFAMFLYSKKQVLEFAEKLKQTAEEWKE